MRSEILTRLPGDAVIGTAKTDVRPGEHLEIDLDDSEGTDDFEGWWCVSTDPWPCPVASCPFVANHLTCYHLIIVWPERDDPRLLDLAGRAKRLGNRNPKVIPYEKSMGHAISYDEIAIRRMHQGHGGGGPA